MKCHSPRHLVHLAFFHAFIFLLNALKQQIIQPVVASSSSTRTIPQRHLRLPLCYITITIIILAKYKPPLKQITRESELFYSMLPIITMFHLQIRGRSQLSTFMKAYTAYARGEGVWDHRTLSPRKSTFIFNH